MVSTLLSFGALFASAQLFFMGGGVLNTLLGLQMARAGFSVTTIGLTLACYFIGLVSGYFLCHHLTQRVGHIRSFAVFAAIITSVVLLHGLHISPLVWAVLRFFAGIAHFGIIMVIESWLNECTGNENRGRVFSIYMSMTYIGMGIGQQILNIGNGGGQHLFLIAALLFSMSLVPVSMTQAMRPELPPPTTYTFRTLFRAVPIGMLGSFAAGMINGAFYSMAPVFGTKIGLSVLQLSWFMTIPVIGGLAVQWIIGIISDRFDRTIILMVVPGMISLFGLVMVMTSGVSYYLLLMKMAIFGGLIFTVYPVAIARANDVFEGKGAVGLSSSLLLCYSIGAIFGPIFASIFMTLFESAYGLYAYWSVISGLFALSTFVLRRKERVAVVEPAQQVNFTPMKNTPSVAMTPDPRTDAEGVD